MFTIRLANFRLAWLLAVTTLIASVDSTNNAVGPTDLLVHLSP
jgi:hypothetical protein